MQLVDRIEKRRFVGREFLLWLWFESEVFEATLATAEHGSFGLWVERQLVVSSTKQEVTRIKGALPASAREAKEGLRLGKLPESAGVHVSRGERECTFTLRAESLALAGLRLPAVLGGEGEQDRHPAAALLAAPRPPRRKKAREAPSDEAHEAFYERMRLTREIEEVVEALYRDFLVLRLAPAWEAVAVPALRAWAAGEGTASDSIEEYRLARDKARRASRKRRAG
jgi:hypothetical protein